MHNTPYQERIPEAGAHPPPAISVLRSWDRPLRFIRYTSYFVQNLSFEQCLGVVGPGQGQQSIYGSGPARSHVPRRSLGTFWARPASESVQNHPDPHGTRAQNTDLDALNPTILFIRRETAGKGKTTFGFHPTKLSVGPTTTRAGIIIPHYPQGGVGEF